MGCGKSSVGRELSRLLCCPFMDLDSVIEERVGRSIPEIFATDGEAAFRRLEAEALDNIVAQPVDSVGQMPKCSRGPLPHKWHPGQELACNEKGIQIVALGGGTVMTPECAEIVRKQTFCIYLKASVETLVKHLSAGEAVGRPMLQGGCHSERQNADEESALRARIEGLMAIRSETYENTAHIVIDTDGKSIGEIAGIIKESI